MPPSRSSPSSDAKSELYQTLAMARSNPDIEVPSSNHSPLSPPAPRAMTWSERAKRRSPTPVSNGILNRGGTPSHSGRVHKQQASNARGTGVGHSKGSRRNSSTFPQRPLSQVDQKRSMSPHEDRRHPRPQSDLGHYSDLNRATSQRGSHQFKRAPDATAGGGHPSQKSTEEQISDLQEWLSNWHERLSQRPSCQGKSQKPFTHLPEPSPGASHSDGGQHDQEAREPSETEKGKERDGEGLKGQLPYGSMPLDDEEHHRREKRYSSGERHSRQDEEVSVEWIQASVKSACVAGESCLESMRAEETEHLPHLISLLEETRRRCKFLRNSIGGNSAAHSTVGRGDEDTVSWLKDIENRLSSASVSNASQQSEIHMVKEALDLQMRLAVELGMSRTQKLTRRRSPGKGWLLPAAVGETAKAFAQVLRRCFNLIGEQGQARQTIGRMVDEAKLAESWMENLKAKVGEAFAAKQASIRRANEYLEETATYQDKYRAENERVVHLEAERKRLESRLADKETEVEELKKDLGTDVNEWVEHVREKAEERNQAYDRGEKVKEAFRDALRARTVETGTNT